MTEPLPAPETVGYDPSGRPVTAPRGGEADTYGTELQQALRDWIVENQTLAVLAGFALGVFVGAMMRR